MWLSSSSVGRKFIMAITGAVLLLFVTFHCLMNSVAICWPTAYNVICEFLGANWYALLASALIAVFIIVHIIYAVMLTLQNRKARGNARYAISKAPATVEWSSRNMFVLGIVVLAFLIVHLIQFWAKMQLVEAMGCEGEIPGAAGTLFIQEAFSQIWTPIVYIIGFVALWFHLNHGLWSVFQSIGWNNATWLPRLKCISSWWVSIVVVLFTAQAIVFSVQAHKDYYKTNPELREQYKEMIAPIVAEGFGENAENVAMTISMMPYDQISQQFRMMSAQFESQLQYMESPQGQAQIKGNPQSEEQYKQLKSQNESIKWAVNFFNYLDGPAAEQAAPQTQMPY